MRNPSVEEVQVLHQRGIQLKHSFSDTPNLRFFRDSPDEGPDCLCSWCGEPIPEPVYSDDDPEGNSDESPAIRLHTEEAPILEARFHPHCFDEAVHQSEVVPAEESEI